MTLHFHSAKAWAYTRMTPSTLPCHIQTLIRTLYNTISADPGFYIYIILFSHNSACTGQEKRGQGHNLCFDEAGIIHGHVDLGCGSVDDSLPPARDALVLIAVAIGEAWKIPIAHFSIDALTGEPNITSECLIRPQNAGVHTVSLTCDGSSCHFALCKGSRCRF